MTHINGRTCAIGGQAGFFDSPKPLDRLLYHAVVIQIEGASYRLRHHAELLPEHIRSKAIITPPIVPTLKRRGRPPKNHHDRPSLPGTP